MLHKQVGDALTYFCILFFIANVSALSQRKKPNNLLSRLLEHSVRHNEPVVIILETEKARTEDSLNFPNKNDAMVIDYNFVHPYHQHQNQDRGYLLRTRNDDSSLGKLKSALRALRARCQQVNICIQECPKKKPSCPKNCQEVFDNSNLCPPPPPRKEICKKPKCGRTMPPSWRMLL